MIEIAILATIAVLSFLLGLGTGRKARADAAPAKRPRKPRKPKAVPAADTPAGDIAG